MKDVIIEHHKDMREHVAALKTGEAVRFSSKLSLRNLQTTLRGVCWSLSNVAHPFEPENYVHKLVWDGRYFRYLVVFKFKD